MGETYLDALSPEGSLAFNFPAGGRLICAIIGGVVYLAPYRVGYRAKYIVLPHQSAISVPDLEVRREHS